MALLDGRVAVVTGGSSGIGRGIALAFADHGVDAVVVADVREAPKERGRPTREEIDDAADAAGTFVHCDVSNADDLESAMDAAEDAGGKISNISRIAGLFGNGGWPTYAASKGDLASYVTGESVVVDGEWTSWR